MLIQVFINLNEIVRKGRSFPWNKPRQCPNCNSVRLWGHGFVCRFFDGFVQAFLIKRYRCPDCGSVITFRPVGYFPRFQARLSKIRASIVMKVSKQKWLKGLSRSRQCHWYQSLLRQMAALLGDTWEKGVIAAFDHLVSQGITPVGRCMKSEKT